LLQKPQVEKAQALQKNTPTRSIIIAGCRPSTAKSKGQLRKGVRTKSTSNARTVSISKLVTATARPIPHQKSQSAELSHHTTNGYDRPLSVRVPWQKDVRKRVRSNPPLSPCQVMLVSRKQLTPRNPQRPTTVIHSSENLENTVRTFDQRTLECNSVRLGDKICIS